jgi:predicted nucleic acid-binding protein
MKALVFDSSSIISLVTNNLLGILKNLKKYYNGEFLISNEILKEIVDDPLHIRRFKLEALQLAHYLADENIKIFKRDLEEKTNYLFTLANNIFQAQNHNIIILQKAEVEALALTLSLDAEALVIDERTTRLLIEDTLKLKHLLERKLHTKITINKENLNYFKKETKNVKILRSSELMIISYELGLFKDYEHGKKIIQNNFKKELLEGILWGLRLRGCAISTEEISEIIRIEKVR